MQKTIQIVSPNLKEWTARDGSYTLVFIEGQFTDGTTFSYGAKPETAQKRLSEIMALVGQPHEFVLEAKGEYQGVQQFKLKDYPGKPQPRGFGGGGVTDEQIELIAQRVAEHVVQLLGTAQPKPEAPASKPEAAVVGAPTPGGATLKQVKAIKALGAKLTLSDQALLSRAAVTESLMELTKDQADELIALMTAEYITNEDDE